MTPLNHGESMRGIHITLHGKETSIKIIGLPRHYSPRKKGNTIWNIKIFTEKILAWRSPKIFMSCWSKHNHISTIKRNKS